MALLKNRSGLDLNASLAWLAQWKIKFAAKISGNLKNLVRTNYMVSNTCKHFQELVCRKQNVQF